MSKTAKDFWPAQAVRFRMPGTGVITNGRVLRMVDGILSIAFGDKGQLARVPLDDAADARSDELKPGGNVEMISVRDPKAQLVFEFWSPATQRWEFAASGTEAEIHNAVFDQLRRPRGELTRIRDAGQ